MRTLQRRSATQSIQTLSRAPLLSPNLSQLAVNYSSSCLKSTNTFEKQKMNARDRSFVVRLSDGRERSTWSVGRLAAITEGAREGYSGSVKARHHWRNLSGYSNLDSSHLRFSSSKRPCEFDSPNCIVASKRDRIHEQKEIANLDLAKLISDLQKERDRLGRAITALLGSASSQRIKRRVGRPKGSMSKKRKRGGLTKEGRRRLSLAMRKRWAEGKMKRK